MQRRRFDDVVVGQGLAGTTLAWQLRRRERSVIVIDRDDSVSASSVAAGLMTPVSGQRLARAWRWDELWPVACRFYEWVERETAAPFFSRRSMVRLFTGPDERQRFASRRSELGELVREPCPGLDPACFHVEHGGFEMPHAGRLHVSGYLAASRARFIADNCYRTARIDPLRDVVLVPDGVELPRFGIRASRLTWCQGTHGRVNSDWAFVDFSSPKGEILTLRIPGLRERRVIHGGVWLAPLGNDRFCAGSTYDWDSADGIPTPAGRDEIANRLAGFLRIPFEVLAHTAAPRPTLRDFRPVLGIHPQHPQTAVLNGLGSKGALYAPALARMLVAAFLNEAEIDAEVSLERRLRSVSDGLHDSIRSPGRPRLTQLAHEIVRTRLRAGDFAVDATAGNGRDTAFLASAVGPDGRVVAFDLQEVALRRTADRLRELGLRNVELMRVDHAELGDRLLPEMCGRLGAVMFNLGYLPGGDHGVTTRPSSTIPALRDALERLRRGGVVTVLAYPGHGGGAEETAAVEAFLRELPPDTWELGKTETGQEVTCPRLFWAIRGQSFTSIHRGCPEP